MDVEKLNRAVTKGLVVSIIVVATVCFAYIVN